MKRIIICPLNWGLGHASRCVPLIKKYRGEGYEIIIAADGLALQFLQKAFPEMKFEVFPGYEMRYPKRRISSLQMFIKAADFYGSINKERQFTAHLVKKYDPDILLSDNRYGVYHKKLLSIFLSHQLNPKAPFLQNYFQKRIHKLIDKFDEIWVPDQEGENSLSGELSRAGNLKNVKYIGPLSRFEGMRKELPKIYKYTALISGVEDQRTVFEEEVLRFMERSTEKCLLIRGLPGGGKSLKTAGNIKVLDFVDGQELANFINQSEIIISRSGYSSIMDLHCLGAKGILVPTPGQTEQKYLGRYLEGRGKFELGLNR